MIGVVKCILLATLAVAASGQNVDPRDVVFHLFTRTNPAQSHIVFPDVDYIMMSPFRLGSPIVVVIHGSESYINFFSHTTHAHLAQGDVNVVAIDWSRAAGSYAQGLASAPACGRIVAEFINYLTEFYNSVTDVKIIGVGLGAHVAGIAARHVRGDVPHVVALDPSLHGWTYHAERLGRDAATVVEVIHTTAGRMGYDEPLGHIDFYPNGGSQQPGCSLNDVVCSHDRAYFFYSESVNVHGTSRPQFVGTRCDNFQQATKMQCSGARDVVFGGLHDKSGDTGILTFVTNNGSPFARN